jgi:hypothetical protein
MVVVDNKVKTYGDVDPEFSYEVLPGTGITGSALLDQDTLNGGLTRVAGNNVGTYAITSELSNPNYAITATRGVLTVNPRPIIVQAQAKTKVFGAETDPQLTYTVLPNGSTTADRLDTSRGLVAGDTLAISLSRGAGDDAGSYKIDFANREAATPRYLQSQVTNPNYLVRAVDSTLQITPRPVRVVAQDAVRTFGEENPEFVYTAERGEKGQARGLLGQDSLVGALASVADRTSAPGIYAIGLGSLVAQSNNYIVEFSSDARISVARIESPLPINKSLNQSLGPKDGSAMQTIPVISSPPIIDTSAATQGFSLNGGLAFVDVQQTASAGIAMTPSGTIGPQATAVSSSGTSQEESPMRVQIPETKLLGYSTVLVVNGGIALPTQTNLIGE